MPDEPKIDRIYPGADYRTPFEILAEEEDWSIFDLLRMLKPDEEYIIRRRYGFDRKKPCTFAELGKECHRSTEWVRQKFLSALDHARQIILENDIHVNTKK